MRDFEQDIHLQKNALDDEWLNQAQKYHYYSKVAVEASAERDRVKLNVEVIEATVEREIRADPAKFGISDKVTEAVVKAALVLDQRVQDVKSVLLDAEKNLKLANAAQTTVGDLKKSLEYLTQLFLSNYWAEPRMPKQIETDVVEAGKADHQAALQQSTRLVRRTPAAT